MAIVSNIANELPEYLKEQRVVPGVDLMSITQRVVMEEMGKTRKAFNEWIAATPEEFKSKIGKLLEDVAIKGAVVSLLAEIAEGTRSQIVTIAEEAPDEGQDSAEGSE